MSAIVFDYSIANPGEPDQNPSAEEQRDEERWDSIWGTLTGYLQPGSSLSQKDVVDTMARYWNETIQRYDDDIPDFAVKIAEQIPYDHPSHVKLASLMLALHHSEKWLSIQDDLTRERARRYSWTVLGGLLRDAYCSPEGRCRAVNAGFDQLPIFHANQCAFVANLVEPEWSPERFDYAEAWVTLDEALRVRPTAPIEARDASVIGAAQFITYQVPIIFDQAFKDREFQADFLRDEGCFSRFRRGKRPVRHHRGIIFHWQDWQAWKHMFATTAVNETYGKTCRDVAQKAADLMALEEKMYHRS